MPVSFNEATLSNGLKVIAEVDPGAHTASIGFFVRTGARDETPAMMGVSHFLEHMMFKGTEHRTAEEVDRQFDALGAEHNAYTTSEMTAFYAHCLPEALHESEAILADILRPALRESDFEQEKKVVLEEIAMYQDQPFWVLYERAMEAYYGAHPLSHRVLGTDDTVGQLSRDQMASYLIDRYSADNTVVALAGKMDFDAVVARLESHCGAWTRTDAARNIAVPRVLTEDFDLTSATAHQHYLIMVGPGPSAADDKRYAASVLLQVLGDVEGSRLYWALVETGLADEALAQFSGRDGTGELLVYAACTPENGERVERAIRDELASLADSLTEDDLDRVRSKVATSATLQGELPAGRMRRLGQMWTYLHEYRSLDHELERIEAVTLDDLRAVLEEYPLDGMLVGRLSPE